MMLGRRALLLLFATCGLGSVPAAAARAVPCKPTQLAADAPDLIGNAQAVREGRMSAEALTRGYLQRIAQFDPKLNAYIALDPSAIAQARAIDARRQRGEPIGPLAGVPVIVKDSLDVADMATTGGWAPLRGDGGAAPLVPRRDAGAVARLREAGAIILGKGNLPALSLGPANADSSWSGPTLNAICPEALPGGSSTGVATAVAAGMAMVGLGAESGGSLQNPAAAQGLVAVKPSFGLVPNDGLMPLSTSYLDTVGVITRTVRDAAVVMDVIAGPDDADAPTRTKDEGSYTRALAGAGLRGVRIGLYGPGWSGQPLSPAVADKYRRALAVAERAGARRVADPFADTGFGALASDNPLRPYLYGLETIAYDWDRYLASGGFAGIDSLGALRARGIDPFTDLALPLWRIWAILQARAGQGRALYAQPWSQLERLTPLAEPVNATDPGSDLDDFLRLRAQFAAQFDRAMERAEADMLFFPQAHDVLPARGQGAAYPVIAAPQINILGVPAVVVPAGRHTHGSPFAIILIGRRGSEAALLAAAHAFELEMEREMVLAGKRARSCMRVGCEDGGDHGKKD